MTLALNPQLGSWMAPLKPDLSGGGLVVSHASARINAMTGLDTVVPHFNLPDLGIDRRAFDPNGLAPPRPVVTQQENAVITVDSAERAKELDRALDLIHLNAGTVLLVPAGFAVWRSLDLFRNLAGQIKFAELWRISHALLIEDITKKLGVILAGPITYDILFEAGLFLGINPTWYDSPIFGLSLVPFILGELRLVDRINAGTLSSKLETLLPLYYAFEATHYVNQAITKTAWGGGVE